MKKIVLDLEELKVDSFDTTPQPVGKQQGTVYAFRELTGYTDCWGLCGGGGSAGAFCSQDCERFTDADECTWHQELTCTTQHVAFPTECGTCDPPQTCAETLCLGIC